MPPTFLAVFTEGFGSVLCHLVSEDESEIANEVNRIRAGGGVPKVYMCTSPGPIGAPGVAGARGCLDGPGPRLCNLNPDGSHKESCRCEVCLLDRR
jgi:hypothetical protein